MGIDITNEMACRQGYADYIRGGNKITSEEYGAITQAWSHKLDSWQAAISKDENEYEIEDEALEDKKDQSYQATKNKYGYTGSKGQQISSGTGSLVVSTGGAAANIASGGIGQAAGNIGSFVSKAGSKLGLKAGKEVAKEAGKEVGTEVVKEAGTEVTKEAGKSASANIGAYVAAAIAIVQAAFYWIARPNKEEKEICDQLLVEMGEQQQVLSDAENQMVEAESEINANTEKATKLNENANKTIENSVAEQQVYISTHKNLQAKVDSNQELTESEQAMYKLAGEKIATYGENINNTSAATTEEVGVLYDDIEKNQEVYDEVANVSAECEGITDFAEDTDVTTKAMCYVEGTSQLVNAASAFIAGIRLMAGGWWNWVIGIAALAAGGASVAASVEQFKMAKEIDPEIAAREATQSANETVGANYTAGVDNFSESMAQVETLEMEIPEDVATTAKTEAPKDNKTEDKPKPEIKEDENKKPKPKTETEKQ